jgi:ribosomal protein S16
MGTKDYVGKGGNVGSAVSNLYKSAGSKNPVGDIGYEVGIRDRNSNVDFVKGKYVAGDSTGALSSAMEVAGIGAYNPKIHELEVQAKARFPVTDVKVQKPSAGGAVPSERMSDGLTDLI